MQRLAESGAELLSETLARLHDLTPRPQHDADATFAPVLEKEDGLIDWSQSAFEIERRIRGFRAGGLGEGGTGVTVAELA